MTKYIAFTHGRAVLCECCNAPLQWDGECAVPQCPRGCEEAPEGQWCRVCSEERAAEDFERSLETAGEDRASELRVDRKGRGEW